MGFSSDALKKGREVSEARKALWETLPSGMRIGPDSPPGVGWVAETPAGRRWYYTDRMEAVDGAEKHRRDIEEAVP